LLGIPANQDANITLTGRSLGEGLARVVAAFLDEAATTLPGA